VANAVLLLLAGHVAVRNLVGNLLWLLLRHPEQMRRLRADRRGLRHAIEEALRFEPPVTMIPRVVAEPFEFRGHRMERGQIVQLCLAAGNRDPARFAEPDRFDAARRPGRHLSFGLGAHACLGALLAREQAEIAVGLLLDAGEFAPDPERPVTWYRNAGNRGPETLPLVFVAQATS
jgi:cytochrome P450